MTRVKVCGLTREEDVDAVVDAGADAAGFVVGFPRSPRNIAVSRAASLISRLPPFITSVLVITGETLADNSDAIKRMAPTAVQLYGERLSAEEVRSAFGVRVLRPYQVGRPDVDGDILQIAKAAAEGCDALLTDTYQKGYDGGTGITSDWGTCAAIRAAIAPTPLILSGGLRPENVEIAMSTVAPFAVDVSSGVESAPGVKDHAKVREFVSKAHATIQKQESEEVAR